MGAGTTAAKQALPASHPRQGYGAWRKKHAK